MMFVLNEPMWDALKRSGVTVLYSISPPPNDREWVAVTHENVELIAANILSSVHQIVMDADRLIYNSLLRDHVFIGDEEILRETK